MASKKLKTCSEIFDNTERMIIEVSILVRMGDTKRPSVCKSNISQMTYCCNYQKKVRDTRKAIAKSRKMFVAEFLRR